MYLKNRAVIIYRFAKLKHFFFEPDNRGKSPRRPLPADTALEGATAFPYHEGKLTRAVVNILERSSSFPGRADCSRDSHLFPADSRRGNKISGAIPATTGVCPPVVHASSSYLRR
jgi:hypothetical protein